MTKQYEYEVFTCKTKDREALKIALNTLGKDGYKFCTIANDFLILEREK